MLRVISFLWLFVCTFKLFAIPDAFNITFPENFKHPWISQTRSEQGLFYPAIPPDQMTVTAPGETALEIGKLTIDKVNEVKEAWECALEYYLHLAKILPRGWSIPSKYISTEETAPLPIPFPHKNTLPPEGKAYFVVGAKGSGIISAITSGSLFSIGGHLWIEGYFPDGSKIAIGHDKGGTTSADLLNAGIKITRQAWIFPENEVRQALIEAELFTKQACGYDVGTHNCANTVEIAINSLGIKLPNFRTPQGLAAPEWLYRQIVHSPYSHKDSAFLDLCNRFTNPSLEHKKQILELYLTEVDSFPYFKYPNSTLLNAIHDPVPSNLTLPKFGGIALNLQADLKITSTDLQGAIFDEFTGQLVLVGSKKILLPEMNVDDLSIAIKSIYGLGGKISQDPAVSIDPSSDPRKMLVNYYGQIHCTQFGWNLYQADATLKALTIGTISCNIPGFLSIPRKFEINHYISPADKWRVENGRLIPDSYVLSRTWITPETIELIESENGNSMIFSKVCMKCMAESSDMKGAQIHQAFAQHFTDHYDEFANQFPIFHEIKRLAQITGIVKWLKKNNIAIDSTYFENYVSKFVHTPDFVDSSTVDYSWKDKGRWHFGSLTGGILLNPTLHNQINRQAEVQRNLYLSCRPTEETFEWDLPDGNRAETCFVRKTQKSGNLHLDFMDLQYPLDNQRSLEFILSYNSFEDKDFGMGIGWTFVPGYIEIPKERINVIDVSRDAPLYVLFKSVEGDQLFLLKQYRLDGTLIFLPLNGTTYISFDRQENWKFFSFDHSRMSFNQQGMITERVDHKGNKITYEYQDDRLSCIRDDKTQLTIQIKFENNRLKYILDPSGTRLEYQYNAKNELKSTDNFNFGYDENHRIEKICIGDCPIFQGKYDGYNRLKNEKWGPIESTNDYTIMNKGIKRSIKIHQEDIVNILNKIEEYAQSHRN